MKMMMVTKETHENNPHENNPHENKPHENNPENNEIYTDMQPRAWEDKKKKPLLIIQDEDLPIFIKSNVNGLSYYYCVRDKPYVNAAAFCNYNTNYVARCVGKHTDDDGANMITYEMISNPDHYLKCEYVVTSSNEFSNKNFTRLPKDYWTNYKNYRNIIFKKYFIDHVELTGIY